MRRQWVVVVAEAKPAVLLWTILELPRYDHQLAQLPITQLRYFESILECS
jgi:hypothetical protein